MNKFVLAKLFKGEQWVLSYLEAYKTKAKIDGVQSLYNMLALNQMGWIQRAITVRAIEIFEENQKESKSVRVESSYSSDHPFYLKPGE